MSCGRLQSRSFSQAAAKLSSITAFLILLFIGSGPTQAQTSILPLRHLVDPDSVFHNQDGPVPFALYGFIEFRNLEELFEYIDGQAGRWEFESAVERKGFADRLLRRGLESRVISMIYPSPREVLVTHTRKELVEAIEGVRPASRWIYRGRNWSLETVTYRELFLKLRERWVSSLNCWSGSPSIAGRVLSNWYVIEEGIQLFGATYDSTEHFWQATKYHPEVTLEELSRLLNKLRTIDWGSWLETLASDQGIYLKHPYAVEFLRHNLTRGKLEWFQGEIDKSAAQFHGAARRIQQRERQASWKLRFTPFEEKVLWGDLADVFHLIHYFGQLDGGRFRSAEIAPVLESLSAHHFDGVYLAGYRGGKIAFISPEFQRLMLEIWKVKFLKIERFREVLAGTRGLRLLHFLNDGDSPDIPIPIYVGYLRQIREMALQADLLGRR